ncbi:site-specific DNA-methyltransferase [Pseudoalteromonas gelatinilytica]|uniref:site-specific DNA-methyltransferase (adenine-specific) n=1 Tax=Pseudoalteromonas gelatinilytica TaxID=1703256 RepID=A0ABQ1T658_9GAMM|nr:site-specific DNA-methyltransferase [Pseudoalteromonas profundi]GGE79884.1 hypothetical protein GCM10008027_00700 [Pseudoalteromonas profundi]
MDKLKMHSPDLSQENIEKIRSLFPNCVTEVSDESGNIKLAIDFDQLKQELSDYIIEGPQERYHLNWPGKRQALLTANAPIAKTLRPCREESVNFDSTENLFIEGDNLEALKILQETYLNKVNVIYIDPPYNTGNDFIYDDDFSESTDSYLVKSNQQDQAGNRLVSNSSSSGRYHSTWLGNIYSRLKIARNFLKDDGVIFLSIDDGEQANLRKICDEIFGENNFVANIIWQKKYAASNDAKYLSDVHDFILCYCKDKGKWRPNLFPRSEELNSKYKNPDNDPRGDWYSTNLSVKTYSAKNDYIITSPAGIEFSPPASRCWAVSKEKYEELLEDNRIWFGKDGTSRPYQKKFLTEVQQGVVPTTLWFHDEAGHNIGAKSQLRDLFKETTALFDTPKPTKLIDRLLTMSLPEEDSIVMDFYAGSGTTAHAVYERNAREGRNDKFIVVQIAQENPTKSIAFKEGYKTLADMTKERIVRSGDYVLSGTYDERWNKDIGFRKLNIDTSNMTDVFYRPDQVDQQICLLKLKILKKTERMKIYYSKFYLIGA